VENKMNFHLVTTSDERTWKSKNPILFLGEWCKSYDRKQVWSKLDGSDVPPLMINKIYACELTANIKEKLLDELVVKLNSIHQVNYSKRSWNIILGHWLFKYVNILYNRYITIENAFQNYRIDSTDELENDEFNLYSIDSIGLIWNSDNVFWNHLIYLKVIKFLKGSEVKINTFKIENDNTQIVVQDFAKKPFSVKGKVINFLERLLPLFKKNKDAFIINSYFPLIKEFQLYLSLWQFPQLWKSPDVTYPVLNINMRNSLKLDTEKYNGFELFLRENINQLIPICYLEGFLELKNVVENLNWPSNPKFIFTSNNFDTDEVFKLWTAGKVEEGVKYFTGQHGNNYGTHFLYGNKDAPERASADVFFSWGWTEKYSNVVPAFNFKITSNNKKLYKKDGGLLLIENTIFHSIFPWNSYFEMDIYQEEQFLFYESLNKVIQEQLIVRVHAASKKMKWHEVDRWQERFPSAKLNLGDVKIWDLIAKSRLVIHSYDSTGILETLALNVPTLCFWQGGFSHLLPEARPYYELLFQVGIIQSGPIETAKMINENWESVDEWWCSQVVQDARIKFCQQYARIEPSPVVKMKALLVEHSR
jgi:putative transferase (TIGR04331 family)